MTGPERGDLADPAVRRARAWLSRAVEPGSVDLWRYVQRQGPVAAAAALRAGTAPRRVQALAGARAGQDVSLDDLRRADRCGGRLVVPEDGEWPAAPLHCLVLQSLG